MNPTPRLVGLASVLVIAFSLVIPRPGFAHVTISPEEAAAGSYFKADFRVPHGCAGSATVKLGVQIPPGVTSVAPQVVPGWDINLVTEELEVPVEDAHGEAVVERVAEVWWEGGPLADAHMQEFGLNMLLPAEAGTTLYFPVVQMCEEGEHHWIEIPAAGENPFQLDEPAPALLLLGAETDSEPAAAETSKEEMVPAAGETDGNTPDGWTLGALALGLIGAVLGGLGVRRRRP